MPVNKKFTREVGRIIKQSGQAIQDATDIESIIQIGEDIEKEGLRMMERAKKELAGTGNATQSSESSSFTAVSSDANISTQQIDTSSSCLMDTEIVSIVSEEHRSVEDLDKQAELISFSTGSVSTILIQNNLELIKRIEELEAQLETIKQNKVNSDTNTSNKEQKNSVKNNSQGNLHLVFKLR